MGNALAIALVLAACRTAPPTFVLAKDGSGSLRFFTDYRQLGPGGAGGGPVYFTRNDVALTADHHATLTKTPVKQ